MQAGSPGKFQSAINVTPLVDVVLVLLIIFMVVVPQLQAGPALDLPETDRPPSRPDDGPRIVVALEHSGAVWIDDELVDSGRFLELIQDAAGSRDDWEVVIKGDARLTFGEVKQVMLAVESAGFKDVGLVAERLDESGGEG
jgi:biopolymer transport protein TolR